jgi:hypothetical protein
MRLAPGGDISKGISTMHFHVDPHLRSAEIPPPLGKLPMLIEYLKHNWLFTACVGTLALIVLCGLWHG